MALFSSVVREGIRAKARRGLLGARMPGYHRHAHRMTAPDYWLAERRPGVLLDPELRFYSNFGMRPVRLVEEYFEDPDSLNWGVIVQMQVPWLIRVCGPLVAALPVDLLAALETFERLESRFPKRARPARLGPVTTEHGTDAGARLDEDDASAARTTGE